MCDRMCALMTLKVGPNSFVPWAGGSSLSCLAEAAGPRRRPRATMSLPPAELERPPQAWQPIEMDDEELGLLIVYAFALRGDPTLELVTILSILLLVLRPQALGCGPQTEHLIELHNVLKFLLSYNGALQWPLVDEFRRRRPHFPPPYRAALNAGPRKWREARHNLSGYVPGLLKLAEHLDALSQQRWTQDTPPAMAGLDLIIRMTTFINDGIAVITSVPPRSVASDRRGTSPPLPSGGKWLSAHSDVGFGASAHRSSCRAVHVHFGSGMRSAVHS